jgi:UDP-N-acetylglucosamine acyltransferase
LETRIVLAKAFRLLYRSGYSFEEALLRIEGELEPIPEIQNLLVFCRSSKRGLITSSHEKEEMN